MTTREQRKIAIHIQSEVQFFSLAPLIKELERKYRVVLVADLFEGNKDGYNEMINGVKKLLSKNGYALHDLHEFEDDEFDLYLTTYVDGIIKAKCYLKYEYGTLNIKPNLTFIPEVMEKYHGFLCQSTITYELLKAYGATFPVDNLRFYHKQKQKAQNNQKVVLFAPTYNDQKDDENLEKALQQIKKHYHIIVKSHHGTAYLKNNNNQKTILEKYADEYYGSDVCLSDLILKADVCVFDNSSALAEALYADVPCAIFAKDLDYFKLGKIHTTQYKLVKSKVLPYTDKAENILSTLEDALSAKYIKAQQACAKQLFPAEFRTGVDGYIKAVEWFLEDDNAKDYCRLHDLIVEKRGNAEALIRENKRLTSEIEEIKSSRAFRLATKLGKIRRKKNG